MKKLLGILTLLAVLVLPFGVMAWAEDADRTNKDDKAAVLTPNGNEQAIPTDPNSLKEAAVEVTNRTISPAKLRDENYIRGTERELESRVDEGLHRSIERHEKLIPPSRERLESPLFR